MSGKRKMRLRVTRKPLTIIGRIGTSISFGRSANEKKSPAYRKALQRAKAGK